jgi:hypothetical protein
MALRLFGDGRIEEVSELEIEANNATDTPLTLIGATGQTANILEVKNNAGTVVAKVEPDGDLAAVGGTFTGTVSLPSTTSIGNVSSTEIGYLDNVTSAIQTQLNAKANLSGANFTGNINIGSGANGTFVISNNFMEIGSNQTSNVGSGMDFHASNNQDYNSRLLRNAGANGSFVLTHRGTGNFSIFTENASLIEFGTNGAARMTINSAGLVGIGQAPQTGFSLSTNGSIQASTLDVTAQGISYPGATVGGGGSNLIGFRWVGSTIYGTVDNAVAMVVGTLSDRRLKHDIKPLENSLDLIKNLRPVQYLPIEFDGTVFNKKVAGLIADEVELIAPELVAGEATDDTYQSVDYLRIIPHLIDVVQKQQEKIEELESIVNKTE